VALKSEDDTVKLWDVATGSAHGTFKRYSGAVYAVAFSPDGQLVASGSEDGIVKLWDVATRSVRSTLKGHSAQGLLPIQSRQCVRLNPARTIRDQSLASVTYPKQVPYRFIA